MLSRLKNWLNKVSFKKFIVAAKNGDLATVQRYIQQNSGNIRAINTVDQNRNSALGWAAYNGHTAIVTALLAIKGIAINLQNFNWSTPLHLAAGTGRLYIVKALLAKPEINVGLRDREDGNTPLILAVQLGHTEVVKAILESSSREQICQTNHRGNSAKYLANWGETHNKIIGDLIEKRMKDLDAIEAASTLRRVEETLHTSSSSITPQMKLDRIGFSGELPSHLVCPISGKIMNDPITLENGLTFCRLNLIKQCHKSIEKRTLWYSNIFPFKTANEIHYQADIKDLLKKTTVHVKEEIDNFIKEQEKSYVAKARKPALTTATVKIHGLFQSQNTDEWTSENKHKSGHSCSSARSPAHAKIAHK